MCTEFIDYTFAGKFERGVRLRRSSSIIHDEIDPL